MLKFRMENFSYNFICTKIFKDKRLKNSYSLLKTQSAERMCAWRSSEKTVVFAATVCTKICGRKKTGCVSNTMVTHIALYLARTLGLCLYEEKFRH